MSDVLTTRESVEQRIAQYHSHGGLFNPEFAFHEAVRDLLIDCRTLICNPWTPLRYAYDEKGNIQLPDGAPFDGNAVLVQTSTGIVEAWWHKWTPAPLLEDEHNGDGFMWVCYDDAFRLELDDVKAWMPLPPNMVKS